MSKVDKYSRSPKNNNQLHKQKNGVEEENHAHHTADGSTSQQLQQQQKLQAKGGGEEEKIRIMLTLAPEWSNRTRRSGGDQQDNNNNNDQQDVVLQEDDDLLLMQVPLGPLEPIAVPATIGRKGLSALINHLLDRGHSSDDHPALLPAIDFEFVIGKKNSNITSTSSSSSLVTTTPSSPSLYDYSNRLLRTTLDREVRQMGLSMEEDISILYFPALPKPQQVVVQQSEPPEEEPDWISSMSYYNSTISSNHTNSTGNIISSSSILCTATYSGSVHLYQTTPASSSNKKTRGNELSLSSSIQLMTKLSNIHQSPIKCLDMMIIPTNDYKNDPISPVTSSSSSFLSKIYIATGSMDHSLYVHIVQQHQKKQSTDDDDRKERNSVFFKVDHYANCQNGHDAAISSLDFYSNDHYHDNKNNHMNQASTSPLYLASGDWDGTICIWKLPLLLNDGQDHDDDNPLITTTGGRPTKKSRPVNDHIGQSKSTRTTTTTNETKYISPLITLSTAHSSNISGITWGNYEKRNHHHDNNQLPTQLISASWDHSIRVWDLERQDNILTLNGSRVITCLDSSYYMSGIMATGHPDCTIRLWDVRINTTTSTNSNTNTNMTWSVSDSSFKPSHKGWVSAIQWSPYNAYQLASTSHDGTVKLWDIRSSLPLHTIQVFHNDKPEKGQANPFSPHFQDHKGLALIYGDSSGNDHGLAQTMLFVGGTDGVVKQLF